MVRIPEPRILPSTIPRLQLVADAGLTSIFAISVATGLSDVEANRLIAGEIEPTDEQRETLEALFADYARAIREVNAETMRRRVLSSA